MRELLSLKCKQKFLDFPEDKNSNRRKVLICGFHKKWFQVIREKTKSIHESRTIRILLISLPTK